MNPAAQYLLQTVHTHSPVSSVCVCVSTGTVSSSDSVQTHLYLLCVCVYACVNYRYSTFFRQCTLNCIFFCVCVSTGTVPSSDSVQTHLYLLLCVCACMCVHPCMCVHVHLLLVCYLECPWVFCNYSRYLYIYIIYISNCVSVSTLNCLL